VSPSTLCMAFQRSFCTARPVRIGHVLLACPRPRPPAYQAAAWTLGCRSAGSLSYCVLLQRPRVISRARPAPHACQVGRLKRVLLRRHSRRFPAQRRARALVVRAALALENRSPWRPLSAAPLPSNGTEWFRWCALGARERDGPVAVLVFS